MADHSPTTPPIDGAGARSWRTPLLVALLVLVIVVVVTFLVRGGKDDPGGAATGSATDSSSSGSPTSPTSGSTSGTPSDAGSSPSAVVPSIAPGVDLHAALKGALKAHFPALIPSEVPAGWTIVAANWSSGLWTLTFTTPGGGTAEVFQSNDSERKLLHTDLPDAQSTGTVDLKKFGTGTWNAWQGPTGVGLTHTFSDTTGLVVAPDQATAVTLTEQLLVAEDGQLTNDD